MRRLSMWFLMVALFLSIGLQWACLQSAAWVGMVVSYSHQTNLSEALVMTFDGKHPCRLCKSVQNGHKNQAKQNVNPTFQKFNLALTEVDSVIFVYGSQKVNCGVVSAYVNQDLPPPTPPPRVGSEVRYL